MILNLDNIPHEEHNNVMTSFWTMLRECERSAAVNNDPVLKHWVRSWAKQWNQLTGDNFVPGFD